MSAIVAPSDALSLHSGRDHAEYQDSATWERATIRAAEMLRCADRGTISELRESVMHKRVITATTAAMLALFLVALPAAADTEHVGFAPTIDWRLVVILTVIALSGFYYVLEVMGRDR